MENIELRLEAYIRNVIDVLSKIDRVNLPREVKEILEIVDAYVRDSIHYLKQKDYFTSLATIAYAEGLLDALRLLKLIDFTWPKTSNMIRKLEKKVLVAGTFEIIHPGHIKYLSEAWKLGRVVAIVARDLTVRKIKGRDVVIPENQRVEVLKNIIYVHKVRLGYEDDMLRVVEEEKPDIILLGPNQPFNEDELKESLKRRGLKSIEVLRLREIENCPLCSTTKIIQEILRKFKSI